MPPRCTDAPALLEALRQDGAAWGEPEVRELGAPAGSVGVRDRARMAEEQSGLCGLSGQSAAVDGHLPRAWSRTPGRCGTRCSPRSSGRR